MICSGLHCGVPETWFTHAHILLFLHHGHKYPTPNDIDKIISAEIPDKGLEPRLYQIVSECMMHGPCGVSNKKSPCMVNNFVQSIFPSNLLREHVLGRMVIQYTEEKMMERE